MIEKKDWEELLKNAEARLHIAEIDMEQYRSLIELCGRKLNEFPKEEEEKMPEELKETLKEIIK